jgi:hypothetical protein
MTSPNNVPTDQDLEIDMDDSQNEVSWYNNSTKGWEAPRNPRKRSKQDQSAPESDQNVTKVSNRFSTLAVAASNPAQTETIASTPTTVTKKPVIPPIIIYGINDYKTLVKSIHDLAEDKNFFFVTRPDNVKLQLATAADYATIVKTLQEKKFVFHTFSNGSDKKIKFIVKGLPANLDK